MCLIKWMGKLWKGSNEEWKIAGKGEIVEMRYIKVNLERFNKFFNYYCRRRNLFLVAISSIRKVKIGINLSEFDRLLENGIIIISVASSLRIMERSVSSLIDSIWLDIR